MQAFFYQTLNFYMLEILIETLKYLLPSLVVLATAYIMLSSVLKSQQRLKEIELLLKNKQETIPVRLQAYERLTLYLERIDPQALVKRLYDKDIPTPQLHAMLLNTIQSEFEHNITQQLYVSMEAWTLVKAVTEEIVAIINKVARQTPPEAPSIDFSKGILSALVDNQHENLTAKALAMLNMEAKQIL